MNNNTGLQSIVGAFILDLREENFISQIHYKYDLKNKGRIVGQMALKINDIS